MVWRARTALRRTLILTAAIAAAVVGLLIGFAVRGGAATPPPHTLICLNGTATTANGVQSCSAGDTGFTVFGLFGIGAFVVGLVVTVAVALAVWELWRRGRAPPTAGRR